MPQFKHSKLKRLEIKKEEQNENFDASIKWTVRDAFLAIIFLVAILAAVYFITAKIAVVLQIGERINSSNITNLSFSVLYGIQVLLMVGVTWFFAVYWRRSKFKDLGLKYYSIIRTIWYSFLSLFLIFAINFLYVFLMTKVFKIAPPASKIEELVINENLSSIILITVVSIIAPLSEELFFRGFLLQAFRKKWGPFTGILLSSIIFAAAHLELYNFIPLMAIGWILGYIFHKTKSLMPVIFLHAIYNLLMILILFSQLEVIKIY